MEAWCDNLALAGSPVQWAVAAALVVLIFAPQLFPPLARLMGRLAAIEMRRRLGMPEAPRAPRRRRAPAVEVLPPEDPSPTLRASDPTPLAPTPRPQPQPSPAPAPAPPTGLAAWWVPAVVCGAIGVILWILLHAR